MVFSLFSGRSHSVTEFNYEWRPADRFLCGDYGNVFSLMLKRFWMWEDGGVKRVLVSAHLGFEVGRVDERVFGGFLEHMGRAVYEGVYEPGSIHADELGCRRDVLGALGEMGMTAMRYPGGNFVSGYHWRDGVGPRGERPVVRELAWQSIEPNEFGTDEFLGLCERMGWTAMMAVNLGTGTPEEARDWVEYCNLPGGTRVADMRVCNGRLEPWGVKLWCLGNEMDGPWQIGHCTAGDYAVRARQAAAMMKGCDPGIEVVACGSCGPWMGTYLEWDRVVLEELGDVADYLSVHRYVGKGEGEDTESYLCAGLSVDQQIEETAALIRSVRGRRRSKKAVGISFDEWNVWYRTQSAEFTDGRGQRAPHLIEEVYTLEDALVVAQFLNSFVRRADVVKVANIAQIVNVIAPVLTRGEEMVRQTIFYPFVMLSRAMRGVSVECRVSGETVGSRAFGSAAAVDAAVVLKDGGRVAVSLVNRSLEAVEVELGLAGGVVSRVLEGWVVTGAGPEVANSFESPGGVGLVEFGDFGVGGGVLPGLSAVVVELELEG